MAAKRSQDPIEREKESFGLLANGSSGRWEVAIDETTSGTERWFAEIEGPSVYFSFEIPSLDTIDQMLQFLEQQPVSTQGPAMDSADSGGEVILGKDKPTPVTLVRDDEYGDRYFLTVGPRASPLMRFVLAGTDLVDITAALRQVKEDLKDDR